MTGACIGLRLSRCSTTCFFSFFGDAELREPLLPLKVVPSRLADELGKADRKPILTVR